MEQEEKNKLIQNFNDTAMSLVRNVDIKKREETTINVESRDTGMYDEHIPFYNPTQLYNGIIKENSAFAPIIESIATNTVGFGYSILPRQTDEDKDDITNSSEEQETIENFFRYINADQDLTELSYQLIQDYSILGYSFCEITRNINNKPDGLYRLQPDKIKLCRKNNDTYTYKAKRIFKQKNKYIVQERVDSKRFRLFVQYLDDGEKIYYKEFQDPNNYEKKTGKLITTKKDLNFAKKDNNLANEIWYLSDALNNNIYPEPRYSGSIIDALGDVHAAKVNSSTFRQNLVPNLAILGDLDQGSMDRIKEFQEQKQELSYNRSRFLILKTQPSEDGFLDKGEKTIKIEKLKDELITDSMFNDYREQNFNRILQNFRLPQLLVAKGEPPKDRKSLESILKFADEQVFNPKRVKIQRFLNDYLLPELNVANLIIKFNTPDVTDPSTLIDLARFMEPLGAMTPERADIILQHILNKKLPAIEGIDVDTPFSKTMAEAVQNTKDPRNINQQVVGSRIKNPNKDADKYQDKKK
jgi:capsid portal protein